MDIPGYAPAPVSSHTRLLTGRFQTLDFVFSDIDYLHAHRVELGGEVTGGVPIEDEVEVLPR